MSAHDAFYTLPDCLLSFILSKMTIKDAVKSSIISKRWRFLYTQMPEFTLYPHHFLKSSDYTSRDPPMSRVEKIISNILLWHSGVLEGFHLHSSCINLDEWLHFSRESVCKWVGFAFRRNVKHLTLYTNSLFLLMETPPPALFSCSSLVTLYLAEYDLTSFPIDFAGFPRLITCCLSDVQLTDESLVYLVSLCPLLQKLEMTRCYGLGQVIICSSTIEHLSMKFVGRVKSSVHCPKLRTLSGYMIEDLSVNGAQFYELSYAIPHLEMDCGGALTELKLDYSPERGPDCMERVVSTTRFLDIVGNFQSLNKLVIDLGHPFESEADMDGEPLFNLLHRLPNLQMLSMLGFFVQELARDPIPDCLAFPHVNLKKIRIEIVEFNHKEVAVISCLLQSMPSLGALEIKLPDEYKERKWSKLLKDIMHLRRASSLARIIVLDKWYSKKYGF